MKHWLIVLALLLVPVVFVAAQEDVALDTGLSTGDCVLQLNRDITGDGSTFDLVVLFNDPGQVLRIPVTRIESVSLSCDSPDEDAQVLQPSQSVRLGEIAPRPNNPEGLARERSGYAIVNTSVANVRSCSSVTCTQVALVDGGDELIVLGHNEDFSWWYVQAGAIKGWISNEIIILRGDLTDVPFIFTEGERTQPTVYVGFPGQPIYDSLGAGSQGVCTINGRSEYPLIGRSNNTDWLFIRATCQNGATAEGWLTAEGGIIRNPGDVIIPLRNDFVGGVVANNGN